MAPVRRRVRNGVVTLTLDVPEKRNALTLELRERLLEEVRKVEADPAVRAIVLTGAAGCFSSGGDLTAMRGVDIPTARQRLGILHDVVRLLVAGRKPVVTAVSGAAFGAGFSLALTGDFVVADETARFSASFGRVGLLPDLGLLWSLPQRVGTAAARQLILDGRVVDAPTALNLGIVDELVPVPELEAAAMRLAEQASSLAPLPVGFSKEILARRAGGLEAVLAAELDTQAQLFLTEDHREAREAFLAKRQPEFSGR